MIRRFILLCCMVALSAFHVAGQNSMPASAYDETDELDKKADSLLALMTLEEKAGQLCIYGSGQKNLKELIRQGLVGGTNGMLPGKKNVSNYLKELQQTALQSRLKIPLLFMGDVIHGYRTTFPVNIAMACSWDTLLIRKADSVAAFEATADGMNWSFAPMTDISRDPRWGRVVEGAGEDPFLASAIAVAQVKGLQGSSLSDPRTMAATVKHFAGYGAVEGGRDYNTADISLQQLHAIYLPPFQAAIRAGVAAVMPAFIALNGIPASENKYLLKNILRKQFRFNGLVVSDYDAIPELINHRVAANDTQAVKNAFLAGMEMDLHSGNYYKILPALIKEKIIPEYLLDSAVRNVLLLKFKLGLFDHPFLYGNRPDSYQDTLLQQHRALARQVGRESIVLLKNDTLPDNRNEKNRSAGIPLSLQSVLPISKHIPVLAVIGPLAKDKDQILGPVHAVGRTEESVSVWEGIQQAVSPATRLLYARGAAIESEDRSGFEEAISIAEKADVVVMAMGESKEMSGEGDSRSELGLPGNQTDLVKAIVATGKPVVVVVINGRPLTIPWLHDHVTALVEAWMPGTETGHAIADVLFGKYNPSGKLVMSFPRNTGQIPVYYNHLNTGRPFVKGNKYTSRYVDIPNSPLYPFGYGLSYTHFSFSPPILHSDSMRWNDSLKVEVRVTNTGLRDGHEIVQLYVSDLVATVSPPLKRLKGFRKIFLKAGESKTISFFLTRKDLAFYDNAGKERVEPGGFELFIGGNSDTQNKIYFRLLPEEPGASLKT